MTILVRDRERHPKTQEDGPVKTEAEAGVLLPQTKEQQEPPEAGRNKTSEGV